MSASRPRPGRPPLPLEEHRRSLTVRLPPELRDALYEYAAEHELSLSDAVARAVRRMVRWEEE